MGDHIDNLVALSAVAGYSKEVGGKIVYVKGYSRKDLFNIASVSKVGGGPHALNIENKAGGHFVTQAYEAKGGLRHDLYEERSVGRRHVGSFASQADAIQRVHREFAVDHPLEHLRNRKAAKSAISLADKARADSNHS